MNGCLDLESIWDNLIARAEPFKSILSEFFYNNKLNIQKRKKNNRQSQTYQGKQ